MAATTGASDSDATDAPAAAAARKSSAAVTSAEPPVSTFSSTTAHADTAHVAGAVLLYLGRGLHDSGRRCQRLRRRRAVVAGRSHGGLARRCCRRRLAHNQRWQRPPRLLGDSRRLRGRCCCQRACCLHSPHCHCSLVSPRRIRAHSTHHAYNTKHALRLASPLTATPCAAFSLIASVAVGAVGGTVMAAIALLPDRASATKPAQHRFERRRAIGDYRSPGCSGGTHGAGISRMSFATLQGSPLAEDELATTEEFAACRHGSEAGIQFLAAGPQDSG